VVCLVARFRIARSEGTLAGGSLASWGLVLSLLVCTAYWAYLGAVTLALKQQSEAYVSEWFDLLRKGQMARAAWRALPPRQRAGLREDDPNLRLKLSERIATEMKMPGAGGGELSQFLQHDVIRAISEGGADTTFESNGIKSWEHKPGGYRIVLSYRITSAASSFDAQIAVNSSDGLGGVRAAMDD